jgi:hypothetical protein
MDMDGALCLLCDPRRSVRRSGSASMMPPFDRAHQARWNYLPLGGPLFHSGSNGVHAALSGRQAGNRSARLRIVEPAR